MPPGEQFKRYYPGLIPIEQALWRAFLVDHETDYESFEYNVHVGEGLRTPSRVLDGDPTLQATMAQRYKELTQKKIDILAMRGIVAYIFEVHVRAEARSLGQLLTYEHLLTKQRPELGQVELCLVCRRIGPDDLSVFAKQGVRVWQIALPGFPQDR
jgi:hypothetical protein